MFLVRAAIFLLNFFVAFGAAGVKHAGKQTALIVEGIKRQAGPVSHGGVDVSSPFPWGSQAAHPASVNTSPSVPFPVTRPLSSPLWQQRGGWMLVCVRACMCVRAS